MFFSTKIISKLSCVIGVLLFSSIVIAEPVTNTNQEKERDPSQVKARYMVKSSDERVCQDSLISYRKADKDFAECVAKIDQVKANQESDPSSLRREIQLQKQCRSLKSTRDSHYNVFFGCKVAEASREMEAAVASLGR